MDPKDISVLVVDDSHLMRNMEKSALTSIGISNITVANDGKEALVQLETTKYDLMLLDWMMPKVSGIEVVEHLRNTECLNKDIPILMVTAEASKDKIMQIIKLKINGYVVKPFTIGGLTDKIKSLIPKS